MYDRHGVDTRVPFVGRTHELRRLEQLLDEHAYVSLVGPGGVGKSRLALEAVLRWQARCGARICFVRLAGVDADAVAGTVVEALGMRPDVGRTPLDTLGSHRPLPARAIVLDNCEDAPAAAREVAERLRERGDTAVIATSRTPLYARDEVTLDVLPFDEADGSAFFAARARIANVDVDVDGRDGPSVRAIVERLDGLAVAIDLAAAKLASLSVERLKDELARPRPVHFRSSAVAEPRHRTINRVVDWSLSKLTDEARRAFAFCGRFAGAFTASDASALLGEEPRAETLLEDLAEQSLFVRGAEGTYTMLAPIRAVAQRRLEQSLERRKVDDRFCTLCGELAAGLKTGLEGSHPTEAMAEVARRYDDFCSALAWGLEDAQARLAGLLDVLSVLGILWTDGGRALEGAPWCQRVLAVCDKLEPLQRARVHYLALRVAYVGCDYERMLALGPKLVSAFTVGGDRLGLARAYNGLAVASIYTGRFDDAKTYADTSLALYRSVDHDIGIANALMNQGSIALEGSRDPVTARERYLEALAIARRRGHETTVALAYGNLAETAYAVHDAAATEENARHALEYYRRIGDDARTIWATLSLARANLLRYEASGDVALLAAAARDAGDALAVAERYYHPDYLALALEASARILSHARAFEQAAMAAFGARRLRRERRVPAFGMTLQQARDEIARLERELPADRLQAVDALVQGQPIEELPQAARRALARAFA